MYEQYGIFLDNEITSSRGSLSIDVISPASEAVIGRSTLAVEADIERAVSSAREAFDRGPWPNMSGEERRRVIQRAGALLSAKSSELSELVCLQNGTTIRSQPGNVEPTFAFYSSVPLPEEDHRPLPPAMDAVVVREPMGIVAAIVPWNSPMKLGLGKVIPALLAGCTVILKPAPETPLHDYVVAQSFVEAGLPPGALSVVPADRDVAEHLVRHQGIDMVSFTGSTRAGRQIGSICGQNIKPVLLELGGKSAAIVLDDFDIPSRADALLRDAGVLTLNGQACLASSRILVSSRRYDEVVDALVAVMESVRIGDPLDPQSELGPLVSERQRGRVEGYIEAGRNEGARVAHGGGRPQGFEKGWYVEPTLFVDADNSMTISREEIFGPVAVVIEYKDEDEAVRIANDSNYGLAGTIFTGDPSRGLSIAKRIRTGCVGVNRSGSNPAVPFGGYKDSGIGRAQGPEGLSEYFQTKTIGLPFGALS